MYYLSTRDFTSFFNSIITTDDKRIELLDIIKTPRGGNYLSYKAYDRNFSS